MAKRRNGSNAGNAASSAAGKRPKTNAGAQHPTTGEAKNNTPTKRTRAGSGGNGNGAEASLRTNLAPQELVYFRELLLKARQQILGDVNHMEGEAMRASRSDASGDLSLMPIHMADIGTDNYEREFTIGLIENETETLKEIDAALKRIEDQTYGVCEATRKPISKVRLKVTPWARYTIAHQRAMEDKGRNHRR